MPRRIHTPPNVPGELAKVNEICDICLKEITECTEETTGDQALLCKGRCHRWMHRWCAAAPEAQYKLLSASDDPFLCPACSHDSQKCEINLLKGMIEALRTEVVRLEEHVRSCMTQKKNSNPIHSDMVKETVDTDQADSVPNEPGCEGWSQVLNKKAKATFAQALVRKEKPKKGRGNGNTTNQAKTQQCFCRTRSNCKTNQQLKSCCLKYSSSLGYPTTSTIKNAIIIPTHQCR